MKNKQNEVQKIGLVLAVLVIMLAFIPIVVFGHALQMAPMLPQSPPQTPIKGIAMFAVIGGAYGIKKLWDKNRHQPD